MSVGKVVFPQHTCKTKVFELENNLSALEKVREQVIDLELGIVSSPCHKSIHFASPPVKYVKNFVLGSSDS